MAWETRTLDEFRERLESARGDPTDVFMLLTQFAETFINKTYANSDEIVEFLHEITGAYLEPVS